MAAGVEMAGRPLRRALARHCGRLTLSSYQYNRREISYHVLFVRLRGSAGDTLRARNGHQRGKCLREWPVKESLFTCVGVAS